MPTIVLRHVTKRFNLHTLPSNDPPGKTAAIATRQHEPDSRDATAPTHSKPPGQVKALDDLSLTIRNGETLSILGPSGCGKTTLLKVIAGLSKPDEGQVTYDGVPIESIPMADRGIGMVFQNYALYPHLPTRDNIGFYDIVRGQPEKIPERIRHIVEIMGVDVRHLLSRKPPTLSGGEQQRVAVARCLARDPKIFLFDEPLSNLDAQQRVETRGQLNRLLRHYSITSVYVTHDQNEAIALAHRIAIMRAGKIEQVGTVRGLYDTPANAFVAQFFGTPPMNLFLGYVSGNSWESNTFRVTPIRPGLQQRQTVWLGIRPDSIVLGEDGVPATVEHVEPILTQQRQLIHVAIGEQPCVVTTPIKYVIERGSRIHLNFPSKHLYFFDQKTGARIG